MWRLGDRLARVPGQLGLWVESLDVAHTTDHEQPDDTLRLGREVRLPVGRFPFRSRIPARDAVAMEHRAQGQSGEAHPQVRKEHAPGNPAAARVIVVSSWDQG